MSAQAFPEHEGLEELVSDGEYELIVLNVCPSHLGFPVKRPRKFMLLVNTSTMSWNPHAAENPARVFHEMFHRRVEVVGDSLARAPPHDIHAEKKRLVAIRNLPARRRSGREWSNVHILSHAQRRRLSIAEHGYKRCARRIFNVMQSPIHVQVFGAGSDTVAQLFTLELGVAAIAHSAGAH